MAIFQRLLFRAIALTLFLLPAFECGAADTYRFDHGPYLQGLTETDATIFFTTSGRGHSRVQVRKKNDGTITEYATVDNGLAEAWNTMNAIRIDNLKPATEYEYRLVSQEMTEFLPYEVTYGEKVESPWYGFRTLDPDARTFSFAAMSDIHDDAAQYRKLLSLISIDQADMVFLVGDIMSYFDRPDQPYTSFIDVSVDIFAREKPFVVVRGNHETRGNLARSYHQFISRQNGHYYGTYTIGDTFVIMLDSGEDKPDETPVYAGITAFDDYRAEQVQWLKEVVKSGAFRKAARRIVMVHIPPYIKGKSGPEEPVEWDHGAQEIYRLFMPILNREKIDLMISGHQHRQIYLEPEKDVNNFPMLINDNRSVAWVECSPEGIAIRVVNVDGETTLEKTIR